MLNAIAQFIAQHILYPFFLVLNLLIAAPVILGGAWLADKLEGSHYLTVLALIIRLVLFGLFLCVIYASFAMTVYFAVEGREFVTSFKAGWASVGRCLAFVPLIGRWFQPPPPDPRTEWEDDDDFHTKVE